MSNICENIVHSYASARGVEGRGVDNHYALPSNIGLDNANIPGAGLEAVANLLLLRRDEVNKLFEIRKIQSLSINPQYYP